VTLTAQTSTGGIAGTAAQTLTEHFKATLRNVCT